MNYAAAYSELHASSHKIFSGFSIKQYLPEITRLVWDTGVKRLLDYGCGKALQYRDRRYHEQWGGIMPVCYDVGVEEFSERPTGVFDGVISTDMLEHIAEEDVDAVLADIVSYADPAGAFVFLGIACRPAKKTFPDGSNLHLTIKPPQWWEERIARFARPGLIIQTGYDEREI